MKDELDLKLEQLGELEAYLENKCDAIIEKVEQRVVEKNGMTIIDCDVVALIEEEVSKDTDYEKFKGIVYETLKSANSISLLGVGSVNELDAKEGLIDILEGCINETICENGYTIAFKIEYVDEPTNINIVSKSVGVSEVEGVECELEDVECELDYDEDEIDSRDLDRNNAEDKLIYDLCMSLPYEVVYYK